MYFFTYETDLPDNVGFSHFSLTHLNVGIGAVIQLSNVPYHS